MTLLAHVSDLHFGRHDVMVAEALLADLRAQAPDVVVVSGDLTQRARTREFQAARAWLDRLGLPWLAVPGNHDIPLFDLLRRWLFPLARWKRYITTEEMPRFEGAHALVLGLSTARRNRWKEGRISPAQIERVKRAFAASSPTIARVLVTHHPFLPAPAERSWVPMENGPESLGELSRGGLDLLLSGHQHRAFSADVQRHFEETPFAVLTFHAGTSISTRTRGEPNTWNLIRCLPSQIDLEVRTFSGSGFAPTGSCTFSRTRQRWVSADPAATAPGTDVTAPASQHG